MGLIRSMLHRRGAKKTLGMMAVAGAPLDFYMSRQQALEEGDSGTMANVKGIANAAGWIVAEPLMWGITAAGMLRGGIDMAMENSKEIQHDYQNMKSQSYVDNTTGNRVGVFGGNFVDNEQAATLRQRQMSLLRQHRMATETILGSEARQLHR
ncbi:hypothetical protein D3C76_1069500 [compost metagenome]